MTTYTSNIESNSLPGVHQTLEVEIASTESNCSEEDCLLLSASSSPEDLFLTQQRKKAKAKMEARNEYQLYKQFKSLSMFNTLIGTITVTLVLVWVTHYRGGFAWTSNPDLQFNWHPLLMTFGMIFMFSQSMLIYRMKRATVKTTLKWLHASMHLIAFISVVIGLKAVFDNHNLSNPPKANLYSMHSWIGLGAVILFSLQFVLGFTTFLYPGLSNEIRKFTLPIHVSMGTAIFLFAVVAAFMGLTEKALFTNSKVWQYSELPGEAILINFIAILLAIFCAMSLHLVNNPDYKRVALDNEQIAITEHTE